MSHINDVINPQFKRTTHKQQIPIFERLNSLPLTLNIVKFKGQFNEINQFLMMTHIFSSDSIRRPLFSTHPTDPELKSENCLDPQ